MKYFCIFSIIIIIINLYGITLAADKEKQENIPIEKVLKTISFYDNFPGKVALTFDDGPDPSYTPEILNILKKNSVKATFFVIGKHAAQHQDIIKRIISEGHTLGNHTYNHINLAKVNNYTILKELQMTQEAVDKALGYHYELKQVRPPWGDYNSTVEKLLLDRGKEMVLWQIDSEDWRGIGSHWTMDTILWEYRRGGTLLFHDACPVAGRMLQNMIDDLKIKGIEFVTVDDLIAEKYERAPALTLIHFNGKLLEENGITINDKIYISTGFMSDETGIKFTLKFNTKEVTFGHSNYKYLVVAKKAFIPAEYLVKDFGLKIETKDKTDKELYYPTVYLDGISFYKKAFIYQGEIYISLKDMGDITGIVCKLNSEKKVAYIEDKKIKIREFYNTPFLSTSFMNELGLLDVKHIENNDIYISLTKFIIKDHFSPIKSYRNSNNEVMVLADDISKALDLKLNYDKHNTVTINGKRLNTSYNNNGLYIPLAELKRINGISIYYNTSHDIIKILKS